MGRKTTKKTRIFYPYWTPKIPGNEGKRSKKQGTPCRAKKQGIQKKNKERKDREQYLSWLCSIVRGFRLLGGLGGGLRGIRSLSMHPEGPGIEKFHSGSNAWKNRDIPGVPEKFEKKKVWVWIFPGGVGAFHVKGWGPKSSVCPSKPGKSILFLRDIPGICRGYPGGARKVREKKSLCSILVPYSVILDRLGIVNSVIDYRLQTCNSQLLPEPCPEGPGIEKFHSGSNAWKNPRVDTFISATGPSPLLRITPPPNTL